MRLLGILLALVSIDLRAVDNGASVVVLYNSKSAASKSVADYYAQKRSVPAAQVIGLPLSEKEAISRKEYREQLEEPFLRKLEELKLISFRAERRTNAGKEIDIRVVDQTKIRYAALCYGVPVKIEQDNSIQETTTENLPPIALRNEAAVDSELAMLPSRYIPHNLSGPLMNPFYAATNRASLDPRSGILMVARLDGPTPEIARGLVDKALQAERDGLWGRAYFDTRGLTNGEYKIGDDMLRAAEKTAARFGYETVLDTRDPVFPAGFPMPQIAIYAGWYEINVAGAFAHPPMEFMPGAFAYHLHSFSAQFVRSTTERWVGPLLARGATCTMGTTEEPFLQGTPDIAVFMGRWLFDGWTFAEAAYASQHGLSWQTTVIGDPLYRPFTLKPQQQHEALEKSHSKFFEWSLLRIININLATDLPPAEAIKFLRESPELKKSALLNEKLGDLYKASGKWGDAIEPYETALKLKPTPEQRLRISLLVTAMQAQLGRERDAYEIYKGLLKDFPNYPERVKIIQKILPLSDKFGKPGEMAEYEKNLRELTPKQ